MKVDSRGECDFPLTPSPRAGGPATRPGHVHVLQVACRQSGGSCTPRVAAPRAQGRHFYSSFSRGRKLAPNCLKPFLPGKRHLHEPHRCTMPLFTPGSDPQSVGSYPVPHVGTGSTTAAPGRGPGLGRGAPQSAQVSWTQSPTPAEYDPRLPSVRGGEPAADAASDLAGCPSRGVGGCVGAGGLAAACLVRD